MNEADARRVLLLRAFETTPSATWSEADAAWASGEAQRQLGERASAADFIAARAALALPRLSQREPAVERMLQATQAHAAWGWVVVLLGFVLGLAGNAVGAGEHINILSPPLLGLLGWNGLVYAGLALRLPLSAWRRGRGALPSPGPVRRAIAHAAQRLAARFFAQGADGMRAVATASATAPTNASATLPVHMHAAAPAWARFAAAWASASAPLQAARLAALLHAAAAALALGALFSLYLRGLAFEYLAGWTSTFLTADGVHALVGALLGPASQLSGIALPDANELAALRFSAGPGENAARWIHLYAITLLAAVVLPRLLLAAVSAWRAHRVSREFKLPLDDAYFARLQRAQAGERVAVQVLPYSYQLPPALHAALASWLDRRFGPGVVVSIAANLPLGGEDTVQLAAPPTGLLVALLALSATPERETHGVFLRALAAQVPSTKLVVAIDESGFRQRLAAADVEARVAQRRAAWQRLLDECGLSPLFVDLRQVAGAD